jgi:ATP-dependent helicase/nuclease subunit A
MERCGVTEASGLVRTAQRRASNPKVSAWVDASAGTGKTKVLTDRVLRLLLDGAKPERILCITFTRAAAAEMANRIIKKLGQWAVMDDSDLVAALYDLTGEPPDAAMQTRARRLFATIVDAPAGFRIQTIHAFCQSVLRRFPLEAGVAPHFDLLDDRTGDEMLAEARISALLDAGARPGEPLARALAVLVEYMDERGFADLVAAIRSARRRLAGTIEAHGGVGLLVPRMWRGLGLEPGTTAADVVREACCEDAGRSTALRQACAALSGGAATDQARSARILAWLSASDRAQLWDDYIAVFLTKDFAPRKAATKAHKAMAHIIDAEAERLVAVKDRIRAAETARATEAMLIVADALMSRYAHAKAARAVLDYDDLIETTRKLLEADAAWVLYKLDGGIDHLLLDEAQDTNPEQWRIVKALAAEFFAGRGARDEGRTLFVVGDEKQSIYSFQGSVPTEFGRMRRHFSTAVLEAEQEFEPVDLTISYRSTPPVLHLVDAVFADPIARDGLLSDFDLKIVHQPHRATEPGLVELWEPVAPRDDEDAAEAWAGAARHRKPDDPEQRLAARIAETIHGWLKRGDPLQSKGRPIAPGDIMILVRRRTRFVGPMVRALKKLGVPVAGIDRLALTQPLAVQDLMALGRFLLLPEDDLTLAALLKSPLIGIDEDGLYRLAYRRAGSLWAALLAAAETQAARFEPARAWLAARLAEVDFVRPFELYARVLASPCPGDPDPGGTGRRALHRRLGPDALDPLDEFLSAALEYERNHISTLEGFIGWLETSDAEIKREMAGEGDAVRIVTVHGAKGLEAPIVFLPDTMQIPRPSNGPRLLWHDAASDKPIPYWAPRAEFRPRLCGDLGETERIETQREYRRLLYVALTRARDRLYIAGWRGDSMPSAGNWHELVGIGMRSVGAKEIEDGDRKLWRFEHRYDNPAESKTQDRALSVRPPLPDWLRHPAPAEPRPFRPLAPSRIEMPGVLEPPVRSPASAEDSRRFRRGRAMHRLLQVLPDIARADRERAAKRLLPEWNDEDVSVLFAEADAVIDDPSLAPLFGPGSRAEVPIAGRIGTRGVAGRIDRLLVEPDRVTVVDFKSGRVPQTGADTVPSSYLAQMAAYRAILRQIYPDRAVALVLVWTDGPVAVTIAPEKLDPFEDYLTATPA